MPAPPLKPAKLFADDVDQTEQSASNGTISSSGATSERNTHIEVCARIRPLQISMQSSSSYFGGVSTAPTTSSSPRKPSLPSNSARQGLPPSSAPAIIAPEDLFYAWNTEGSDTAAQSPRTELIPGRTHQYTLDKVYGPSCTTRDLYNESVKDLVNSAMEGYHTAVLAYGQTSTGKTHSMTGTPTQPGIIPLSVHQCFQCLDKNREYLIRVSYLEVYKEQIRDLLAEGASQIRLFDHREQGLIIKGLREEVVTCPKQIFEILAQGEKRRKIGATNMNQHSSRSHVMVRLWIESRAVESNANSLQRGRSGGSSSSSLASTKGSPVRVSSLSLVDLAGSESVKLHGANETRRQEGHYINKSLMALGKVVYALSEQGKQKAGKIGNAPQHIPYRDSKLTRLLQPSLSGNAQMVLICCISPLETHIEESHNTFKFAIRAKKVPQKATIQKSLDDKTLLQTYREEIEALKQQLREAKKQQLTFLQEHAHQVAEEPENFSEEEDMDDEVQELKLAIRNMEHLILKSKTASPPGVPSSTTSMSQDELLDAALDSDNDGDDGDDEVAMLALMAETQKSSVLKISTPTQSTQSPPRTPRGGIDPSVDMHKELNRIQGLLGSVLKKRTRGVKSPPSTGGNGLKAAEVNKLRAQLEEQEVTSSLRQADSSFLQKQLDDKDSLLAEVSKILEQVEQRQVQLEAENTALKAKVTRLESTIANNPT